MSITRFLFAEAEIRGTNNSRLVAGDKSKQDESNDLERDDRSRENYSSIAVSVR